MTFPLAFGWPCFIIFLFTPIIANYIKNKFHARARILQSTQNSTTFIAPSWMDKYILDKPWYTSSIQREIHFGKVTRSIASLRYQCWIISLTVALYSFPYSILIDNLSEWYSYNLPFHIIQFIALTLFYITCYTDPGIIKSQPVEVYPHHQNDIDGLDEAHRHLAIDEKSPLLSTTDEDEEKDKDSAIKNGHKSPPKSIKGKSISIPRKNTQIIEINSKNRPSSYCEPCGFIKPLRSKYCYEIGKCVARFDHYSDMVGNAIGAKNHRFFVLMLLFESAYYLWSVVIVINAIIDRAANPWDLVYLSILGWTVVTILLIFVFIMGIYKLAIFVLQARMISVNTTTYELLKPQDVINAMNEMNAFYDGSYIQGKGGIDHQKSTAVGNEEEMITGYGKYFNKGFINNWIACLRGYDEHIEWFTPLKCKMVIGE